MPVGVLPQPADAAFECRIKKSITSGTSTSAAARDSIEGAFYGESYAVYPAHIYASVASNECTADATALSSRAATVGVLRCSDQTNLPVPTTSGGWGVTSTCSYAMLCSQ